LRRQVVRWWDTGALFAFEKVRCLRYKWWQSRTCCCDGSIRSRKLYVRMESGTKCEICTDWDWPDPPPHWYLVDYAAFSDCFLGPSGLADAPEVQGFQPSGMGSKWIRRQAALKPDHNLTEIYAEIQPRAQKVPRYSYKLLLQLMYYR
jgi:hypothetical protein